MLYYAGYCFLDQNTNDEFLSNFIILPFVIDYSQFLFISSD